MSAAEAEALVTDEQAVARRSFWPLISVRQKTRRWKAGDKTPTTKIRPIAYASHADSHIYSYYTWKLTSPYECALAAHGLAEVVLAYRKHRIHPEIERGKASFHFAAEAFAEIAAMPACDVVAIDVKGFFDSVPHRELKRNWRELLEIKELPPDHYAVFKSVTAFSCVPLAQVRQSLGIGRRRFRKRHSVAMNSDEFNRLVRDRGIIDTNRKKYGIPQGLPISGLLANIAMFHVDRAMHEAARAVGASYRRYSDDILIISPPGQLVELEKRLCIELGRLDLQIQSAKTLRGCFKRRSDKMMAEFRQEGDATDTCRPLQYLGLEFDGQRVLVRPQTLAKFGKRMACAVRRARNAARKYRKPGMPLRIRRRDLYARYSYLRPHRETPKARRPKGSMLRYAALASKAISIEGAKAHFISQIDHQLRGQWNLLQRLIAKAERELAGVAS